MQCRQEAAATSSPVGGARPTFGDDETGAAGFRPLGVREPALRSTSAARSSAPQPHPVFGSHARPVAIRMQGRVPGPQGWRPSPTRTVVSRSPVRPRVCQQNTPSGGACDGAPSPRSRGRPEPPPPGVPLVQGRKRTGRPNGVAPPDMTKPVGTLPTDFVDCGCRRVHRSVDRRPAAGPLSGCEWFGSRRGDRTG